MGQMLISISAALIEVSHEEEVYPDHCVRYPAYVGFARCVRLSDHYDNSQDHPDDTESVKKILNS